MIPALIIFFVLHTYPLLQGVFYSFTDWKGYGNFEFVKLKNYFKSPLTPQGLGLTDNHRQADQALFRPLGPHQGGAYIIRPSSRLLSSIFQFGRPSSGPSQLLDL